VFAPALRLHLGAPLTRPFVERLSVKILLQFARQVDELSRRAAVVAIWLVLICALVSALNALSRYIFDMSSNAWLELQWYMFGGIVLLGAAHLLNTNGHIRVDLSYGRLSDRQRTWLDLFGLIAFLMPFCWFMVLYSWPWFLESWQIGEISANAGGLTRWPVKLLLPLGFGLLMLQGVSEVIKRVAALRGVIALDTHYERPLQ
jgi:TRAP-type mannitol/chloroaromatic compound transport system permease small subunit